MTIVLAPSNQTGNRYAYGGTNEAVQCAKISNACESFLQSYEVEVLNWLPPAWGFEERVQRANQLEVDLFLSIHTNAGGGRGVSTFIGMDGSGRTLGEAINREISSLGVYNRGIKQRAGSDGRNWYYEIRVPKMDAVMVECAFHDHPEEAKWIVENTKEIGEAIGKALVKVYDLKPKSAPPSGDYDEYVVKKGDTLGKIARTYDTTVAELARINNISNPDLINVGQKVLVPKAKKEESLKPGDIVHISDSGLEVIKNAKHLLIEGPKNDRNILWVRVGVPEDDLVKTK